MNRAWILCGIVFWSACGDATLVSPREDASVDGGVPAADAATADAEVPAADAATADAAVPAADAASGDAAVPAADAAMGDAAAPTADAAMGDAGEPMLGSGTSYYVSNDGDDSASGTSPSAAWRTIAKVQNVARAAGFEAGDNILFRRGDRFAETLFWSRLWGGRAPVGTADDPITLASYGTGAKPIFEYPPLTSESPEARDRVLFGFYGVTYIVIDGLNFTDLGFADDDKTSVAHTGIALQFNYYGDTPTSDHNTVRNCDFSKVGLGVVFNGDFNTVDRCTFRDLKVLVNTMTPDYDDYLANGVTITGNDLLVQHSLFEGNWADSYDFGTDGGAIEAFGDTSRIQLLYNTFIDCAGVMEVGSTDMSSSSDHLVAYNTLINNYGVVYISGSGTFATSASNFRFYNNTIIDTPSSRWPNDSLFSFGGTLTGTVFDLRNNVFYVTSQGRVVRSANAANTRHENNVYVLGGSASAGFTLGSSEISTTMPVFASAAGTDPAAWNLVPISGSAAIGAGQNLGLGFDVAASGAAIASPPNAGAY